MKSCTVVKANNVVGDIGYGLKLIGIVLVPDPLHLQIQEEAFHDSVIPTISFSAHAAHQAVLDQQRPVFSAGVLGGFNGLLQHLNYGGVAWEDQRGGWKRKQVARRCVRQGALRSISGSRSRHFRAHCPAHDLAQMQVQHSRQVQPATTRTDVGDIGYPRLVGQGLRELPIQNIGANGHVLLAVSYVDELALSNRPQAIEPHQGAHTMPALARPRSAMAVRSLRLP